MIQKQAPIVTIDGPSGVGKGTIGHMVARFLGWHFLDSGALYRLTALQALKKNIPLDNALLLSEAALSLDVEFISKENKQLILLNGVDVTEECRDETTGQAASVVSAIPEVRNALLARQRAFWRMPGLVADGRDMGTVVFYDAALKIFLEASASERAARRQKQLSLRGIDVNLSALLEEINLRDARDRTRAVAPLRPAQDAIIIETSTLSIEQVFQQVLREIERVFGNLH